MEDYPDGYQGKINPPYNSVPDEEAFSSAKVTASFIPGFSGPHNPDGTKNLLPDLESTKLLPGYYVDGDRIVYEDDPRARRRH